MRRRRSSRLLAARVRRAHAGHRHATRLAHGRREALFRDDGRQAVAHHAHGARDVAFGRRLRLRSSPPRLFPRMDERSRTSTATRTSADSFAKFTDAETHARSISKMRFTFAVHPPQCMPRTSRSTTSSRSRRRSPSKVGGALASANRSAAAAAAAAVPAAAEALPAGASVSVPEPAVRGVRRSRRRRPRRRRARRARGWAPPPGPRRGSTPPMFEPSDFSASHLAHRSTRTCRARRRRAGRGTDGRRCRARAAARAASHPRSPRGRARRRARSRGCVAGFGPGANADEDITRIDVRLRA